MLRNGIYKRKTRDRNEFYSYIEGGTYDKGKQSIL